MNGRFAHIAEDGTRTDVTEGVQALYDLVISSLNWGSGFWSYEDALPVARIARLGGFKRSKEAERYVREALHCEESGAWRTAHWQRWGDPSGPFPHDHVFSTVGRCMWPQCKEEGAARPSGRR